MNTSKSPEKLTSLDQYISRMKPDQKDILYIAGVHLLESSGGWALQQLKVPSDNRLSYCSGSTEQNTLCSSTPCGGIAFLSSRSC